MSGVKRSSPMRTTAKKQEPREGEKFDLEDVRKDEECADTVGVYLHVDEKGKAHIRMTLGPEVQTLTRAMTAILCKGLEGARRRRFSICRATSSHASSAPSSCACAARPLTTC